MAPLLFIFLLLPNSINAYTDPSDASALMAMYQNLNSPGQLTKWSSTGGDPCEENWKGVTCDGSRVTEIQLSSLGLSGGIGYQLSSLTSLINFDVSNNYLGNQIPYNLPPNLQRLNLAGCGYSGNLPYSISQMTSLKYLNVARNQISGQLPDMFGQLSALSTLDLSFNSLTGDLPKSFSLLSSATDMYLENNQLTGTIDVLPIFLLKICENIANNKFTGWVPSQLENINLQKDGNSLNSGNAPPAPPGTPAAKKITNQDSGVSGGAITGIVVSILVVGAFIAFFLLKKRSKKSSSTDIEKNEDSSFAPVTSEPHAVEAKPIVAKKVSVAPPDAMSYSIADLQIATDSFSADNLIGEGSTARVFRAKFEDGKVLAVKKIKPSALPGGMSEDFIDIVSDVSRLRHPNVNELVGYCSEHGQHLLVYEFLKNGSLYDFLHLSDEYSKPLIWNSRVKIALGTARALEYLHEVCLPSVVHKNIKSANILLDSELNPHLSDCGLASLVPDADQASDENDGSGYSAPEVSMSGQYTVKSDVYGFGVTMLELVTGRKPFDRSRTRAEQCLVQWATPQLHDMDALGKMVDPALNGLYPVKSLSRFADVIALCVQVFNVFFLFYFFFVVVVVVVYSMWCDIVDAAAGARVSAANVRVVEALVRLVQRANMSKRTVGIEQGSSVRSAKQDS
ncbi:hypothetical protein OSB04_005103 [Centaurea solstitialis]|uniref:Protein kinase domain-containing protein n=1 Tax=Centaurea solstitialis TaxID=347529 RepID=A0AA38U008_9ASTR|nr:hypothetical protein OSB04_005103 [Centaurea solstitialis]